MLATLMKQELYRDLKVGVCPKCGAVHEVPIPLKIAKK
jgi:hypothetical protein